MTSFERPVRRRTSGALDGSFGCDSGRRLVVELGRFDTIKLRPEGTRRPEIISALDIYRYAVRCRVNRELLERARKAKEWKARERDQRKLKRMGRRQRS